MIIVPAIDLRGGRVVRLRQGQLENETIYGGDPAEVGKRWEAAGARRLHVVDLDAAISGKPQFDAVATVIDAVTIPVEVGGGLRVLENAMRYRDRGADRVIFGTAAVADPGVVQQAVRLWPEAVAVALDAKNGMVAVAGWREITTMGALDLAERVRSWGVPRIQYTDVVRDGTLVGPNLAAIEQLARSCGLRITAAGGVSTREDLVRLQALGALGVDEVIVGKALYEERFTVADAQAALGGTDDAADR
jgi:phosphoribosylformimino-5-aminoimidazole carboxamide ribotide isomerase